MTVFRILPLIAFLLACRGRPNVRQDALEAELRTRDRQNRELQESLEASRNQNRAVEGELQRGRAVIPGGPADGSIAIALKDMVLGTGTMGLSQIGQDADEGFQVVIVPRDIEASPIKAPGSAVVSASEILPNGTKARLGSWSVEGADLRPLWKSGLFSTGYYVPVYWQRPPVSKNIRITVRFTALNGQTFEAEKDISIRLSATGAGPSN